jgi:hypothetical protein
MVAAANASAQAVMKQLGGNSPVGLEAARRHYLDRCAEPGIDLNAERDTIIDAFKEIMGKRFRAKGGGT